VVRGSKRRVSNKTYRINLLCITAKSRLNGKEFLHITKRDDPTFLQDAKLEISMGQRAFDVVHFSVGYEQYELSEDRNFYVAVKFQLKHR